MAAVMGPVRPRTFSTTKRRATLGEIDPNILSEVKAEHAKPKHDQVPAQPAALVDLNATQIISSPYPDVENQLRLTDLDTPYKLFAFALTAMNSIREDYATAPYLESFNWPEVFGLLRSLCQKSGYVWDEEREFYVVIFRSKLQPDIDRDRLGLLDKMSHQEACASGGLLKYWFGSCDSERRNLATCLWRSHPDAVKGGAGPWHKQARAAGRYMYERIDFQIHKLVVEAGAESWRLEDFKR